GSFTQLLAQRAGAVVAVEIDPVLASIARVELADYENVRLLNVDVLENKNRLDGEVLDVIREARRKHGSRLVLAANLPYQAAAPLMINLLLGDEATRPAGIFVTVQKEVAQRIVAAPGTKDYGLLSILLQATGETRLLRTIKPQAFWPAPAVHSAMIAWTWDAKKWQRLGDPRRLRDLVQLLLGNRRKKISTLLKTTSNPDWLEIIERLGIDPNARGEILTPEQFINLSNSLYPK
ncbi:hypothetical protein JW964_06545, partial [candidate division KSB1 bacterium]|nr:hypothetical protein [candidate division KSB1 bacterium]